jgi:hypothetical protein
MSVSPLWSPPLFVSPVLVPASVVQTPRGSSASEVEGSPELSQGLPGQTANKDWQEECERRPRRRFQILDESSPPPRAPELPWEFEETEEDAEAEQDLFSASLAPELLPEFEEISGEDEEVVFIDVEAEAAEQERLVARFASRFRSPPRPVPTSAKAKKAKKQTK